MIKINWGSEPMFAKWIGEDRYVGPKWRRTLTLKHNEVRKIHAKDGDLYLLEGIPGSGYQFYGWVDGKNLELESEMDRARRLINNALKKT